MKKDSLVRQQYISMIICWLAYTCTCLGRYSYSANIILVEKDYGVTHANAGLVMTMFATAYGLGQFIHGALCRKYPRRWIVSISLIVVSLINLSLFLGVPFRFIKYLWLISAVFQSIMWPLCVQIISENVGEELMSKAILLMSTTTSLGTFLAYGISAVFADINYKITFLISSIILFSISVAWYILYKPGDFLKSKNEDNSNSGIVKEKVIYIILPIILLGIFSITTNFLKDGIQTWVPNILKSIKTDLPDSFSIALTLILPLFGVFGAFLAVKVNKKIPKAIPLSMFFFGFIALFNAIVYGFKGSVILTVISFGLLELLLHASSVAVVSIFPLLMREKMSSGSLAGLLNGAAYIGTASSSYVLGKIADVSGWSVVFATLFGISVSMFILGAIYLLFSVKYPKLNV